MGEGDKLRVHERNRNTNTRCNPPVSASFIPGKKKKKKRETPIRTSEPERIAQVSILFLVLDAAMSRKLSSSKSGTLTVRSGSPPSVLAIV